MIYRRAARGAGMMKISWIEKGVLAGSGVPLGIDDVTSLKEQGIGAIVTLTEHALMTQRTITPEAFDKLDLFYMHAPIPDGNPPDKLMAETIVNFIDKMTKWGRATLVHCAAGSGRTGTILHAYYLAHGDDLETAKLKVKTSRPVCAFIMLSDSQREFLTDFAAKH
jgi:protein-tyrosine phosphatase